MFGSEQVKLVGASDGLGVVGARVDSNVGREVAGIRVGDNVGEVVGPDVGEVDGSPVGGFDRSRVGLNVGLVVGPDVGEVVGLPVGSLGVGARVGSAMQYAPSSPQGKIPFQLCVTRPTVSTLSAYTRSALTPSYAMGM
jgi:hypothetical protein